MSNFTERLTELMEKASSKGPFIAEGCYITGGDRDIVIYDEGGHTEDDANIIAFLLEYATAIRDLVAAADTFLKDPRNNTMLELHNALAKLEEA